ncbi:hypothetical protein SGRA_1345 [Saprospira grandis str. Lewin]|uniref:Uncharacterized protein n=1 Tax=Saprospira grandis (strain Lewin) TaxID=984262 RepID=H6L6D8_SAPGL|nr:hypothetical protein SGRA_1345 [Saprospira grandis str. Lewin]
MPKWPRKLIVCSLKFAIEQKEILALTSIKFGVNHGDYRAATLGKVAAHFFVPSPLLQAVERSEATWLRDG